MAPKTGIQQLCTESCCVDSDDDRKIKCSKCKRSILYVQICQCINCACFTQRTTEASFVSIVSKYLMSSEKWSTIKEKV